MEHLHSMHPSKNVGFLRKIGSKFFVYVITLLLICVFVYFIYKFIYGASAASTNLILTTSVDATKGAKNNIAIPNIYEGGEFSTNFWVYLNAYNTGYLQGQRKHLVEIGHTPTNNNATNNFSTILIMLGATTPTLLVRVHTKSTSSRTINDSDNYGITDCSGGNESDCSGGTKIGFQKLIDKNLVASGSTMMDNTLTVADISGTSTKPGLFTPYANNSLDENIGSSPNTCDVKELPLQKWVNICTVMNGKTLDVYLDGKLVKTCVYNSFFKVDQSGTVGSYLQHGGFNGNFSRLQIFNTSLTPDDIYKNYLSGPTGSSATSDPISFMKYIFTG